MIKNKIPTLANYSAFVGAFLVMHEKSGAQVVYTDVDPDAVYYGNWAAMFEDIPIDFNADVANDITLQIELFGFSSGLPYSCDSSHRYWFVNAISFDGIVNNFPLAGEADVLNWGDTISVDDNLQEGDIASMAFLMQYDLFCWWGGGDFSSTSYEGNWMFKSNKFLGIRFSIGGEAHFGWIRLSIGDEPFPYLKIQDFAYNTVSNEPIVAGEGIPCTPPSPLGTAAITPSSAKPKWFIEALADHYELQYRVSGTEIWTTKNVPGVKSFRKIIGLTCATSYDWRIRSFCTDGTISDYSAIQNFTTAPCRMGDENTEEENVNIWSNGNVIYIETNEELNSPFAFTLFDQMGNKVFEQDVDEISEIRVDLASGIYIACLNTGNNLITRKIFISN